MSSIPQWERPLRPAIDFFKRTPILAMSAQTPPRPLDGLTILVIDDDRDTVDGFGSTSAASARLSSVPTPRKRG